MRWMVISANQIVFWTQNVTNSKQLLIFKIASFVMSRKAEHEVDIYVADVLNVNSKENMILLKCFISKRNLMLFSLYS